MRRLVLITGLILGLLSPAQAQEMMMGMSGGPDAGSGFVGPLDSFPAPTFVCSLRRMLSAYAGKTIHVTGSGGATSGDVGFTAAGDFDVAGYNALKGSGTEAVDTCYDQSGNVFNATQATGTKQPAVSLTAINNKPAISFTAANSQALGTASGTTGTSWTANVVSTGDGTERFAFGSASSTIGITFDQGSANTFNILNGSFSTAGTASDGTFHSATGIATGTTAKVIVDGTTTSGTISSGSVSGIAVGALTSNGASFPLNTALAELIIWNGDQTANIPTLRANQKAYYATP